MPNPIQRPRLLLYAAVVALAVAASATSLRNGFALDDIPIVAGNARVHSLQGWWRLFAQPYWSQQFGTSLYRPVITLGYALQWAVGDGAAWPFHLTSVVLYAASSVLVLALFLLLLPAEVAFVGAALFAVHPVHVEAVANVVGQAELVTAIATLAAAIIYVRQRRHERFAPAAIVWIAALFGIACLTKEHGILLPALLLALELFAVPRPVPAHSVLERARRVAPLFVVLATVAIAYVVARTLVVGDVLGELPQVPVHGIARLWVLLAVAPHWVRLMAWPSHLSADYSPHAIAIPGGPGPEIVVGLVVLLAALVSFKALGSGAVSESERRTLRLGLAWMAITLLPVSNLFTVVLLAERTLFLPSVGAMLTAAALASLVMRRAAAHGQPGVGRMAVAGVTTVLVVLGTIRSSRRQPVWRDNATLFEQTVVDVPSSYRAQFFLGQLRFEQGRRAEGERHLALAIRLNPVPSDVSPLNYLATQYRDAGLCAPALPLYERAIAGNAARPDVRYGLARCLLETGRLDEARSLAAEGARRGDLKGLFLDLIARTDSASASRR